MHQTQAPPQLTFANLSDPTMFVTHFPDSPHEACAVAERLIRAAWPSWSNHAVQDRVLGIALAHAAMRAELRRQRGEYLEDVQAGARSFASLSEDDRWEFAAECERGMV